jgi:TrmH family RNA methyltransferase
MKSISSRTNPEIKHLVSLQAKKYRTEYGQFIAEGLRTCNTLIAHGHIPIALYVTARNLIAAQAIIEDQMIILIRDHVMEKISTTNTPSGIVGLFEIPKPPSADQLTSGLVLAQIADPGNTGTLMRTAAALNTKSVVIIEGTDPWSPKVVQASAGTIGMIDIFQWSWEHLVVHKGNNKLYALTVSSGKDPQKITWNNTLLVIGSEAHGIPQEWVAACEERVTLPMPGGTESLNAAVAGSIALYLASTH